MMIHHKITNNTLSKGAFHVETTILTDEGKVIKHRLVSRAYDDESRLLAAQNLMKLNEQFLQEKLEQAA